MAAGPTMRSDCALHSFSQPTVATIQPANKRAQMEPLGVFTPVFDGLWRNPGRHREAAPAFRCRSMRATA
jgi:hypothetical protein